MSHNEVPRIEPATSCTASKRADHLVSEVVFKAFVYLGNLFTHYIGHKYYQKFLRPTGTSSKT